MAETSIEWATYTWNLWWGCTRVSPACDRCYAANMAKRFGVGWGPTAERRIASEKVLTDPFRWDRKAEKAAGKRRAAAAEAVYVQPGTTIAQAKAAGHAAAATGRPRVFTMSMGDIAEDNEQVEPLFWRALATVALTPHLDHLWLTKRPDVLGARLNHPDAYKRVLDEATKLRRAYPKWDLGRIPVSDPRGSSLGVWWPQFWVGTTVEDQQRANERIPHLLRIQAAVRFLSVEPMLGPIDVEQRLCWADGPRDAISWVIGGGESGPHARPTDLRWARALRDSCVRQGTPFFWKQWGEWAPRDVPWDTDEDASEAGGSFVAPRTDTDGVRRAMVRVGKHAAGRLIDGVEWSQFPEVSRG